MNLLAYSNRVPQASYTQRECWEIFTQSNAYDLVNDRSRMLMEKVLHSEHGIDKRHFAHEDIGSLYANDAESLYRLFEHHAPRLAAVAVNEALEKAGLAVDSLDAIMVCTCTGYLCPGISSYVAEQLGMRRDAYLQDIVGLGCGALVPTLRSAYDFLKGEKNRHVAVVAVEICSAAFYIDNDPGVLISLCLFGDGCSASIWSSDDLGAKGRLDAFDTVHYPENRDQLRFENKGGKLRNRLHLTVPVISSRAVEELFRKNEALGFDGIISHGGGRDVLAAIERRLPDYPLQPSWNTLADFGNMSSPSVFFGLADYLENGSAGNRLWLTSFGAGFACHGCRFQR